jgi:hypothetical protein
LGSLKTIRKIDESHLNSLDFFLDPPEIIGDGEKEKEKFWEKVENLNEEEKFIFSYIPDKRKYEEPLVHDFDLFAKKRIKNLQEIE